MLDHLYSDQKG